MTARRNRPRADSRCAAGRGERRLLVAAAALLGALFAAAPAEAHKPSDAYLALDAGGRGHLDLAVRDLHDTLGLDEDGDGIVRGAELTAALPRVTAYVTGHLAFTGGDGAPCPLTLGAGALVAHGDGPYLRLPVEPRCGGGVAKVRYDLFFERDPAHHGLVATPRGTIVLTAERRAEPLPTSAAVGLGGLLWDGVVHIWTGADHLAFLLTLLLGVLLGRDEAPGKERPIRGILATVTAFTAAHSLTLAAGAFGYPTPPVAVVESAIAGSVLLAAVDNLRPLFTGRRWAVAFALGLLHGFGFSGTLRELGLHGLALVGPLVAFNGGVELGQLAVLAVILPPLLLARRAAAFREKVIPAASIAVAVVAALWIVERVTGRELIPG